ncbi:uncharacterized protein K441DRAFT_682398 [Cenococcum geophilum 1.58]|uniref:Uncharacterized protein n=1 Tax=Cenococcum geophilum 1.58 TaxID=794803 RepID=A0ACC8EN95_9PEZI|nr:hypothetical protein K441DRAFT_682398 [Cenococcum geophilum 1.58]
MDTEKKSACISSWLNGVPAESRPQTPIPDKGHAGPEHSTSSSTAPLNSGGSEQQTSYTGSQNTGTSNASTPPINAASSKYTAGRADNGSDTTPSSTIVGFPTSSGTINARSLTEPEVNPTSSPSQDGVPMAGTGPVNYSTGLAGISSST